MAQFDACVNIDPTCTVLTVRDDSGQVVHRERKPPRWGLTATGDDFDFATMESDLLQAGYRRPDTAAWVRGHWSVHTVVQAVAGPA